MIPKEKAKELVESFIDALTVKDCALIAVDQIIIALNYNQWQNTTQINYFIEVKQEIEKL
jgi:hypothetical protein